MGTDTKHPEAALLEYINSSADPATIRLVEEHLGVCVECSLTAAALHIVKREAGGTEFHKSSGHPGVGELASFFYDKAGHSSRSNVAAHVALCGECAHAIAMYERAERYAAAYSAAANKTAAPAVPESTWRMISDWEEKDFPGLKSESETLTNETISKLLQVLREHKDELEIIAKHARFSGGETGELVPVIVLGKGAEFQGVEVFKRESSPGGETLVHPEESERFHSKPVHAVVDLGRGDYRVISEKVHRSSVRLRHEIEAERAYRTDYFIIDD